VLTGLALSHDRLQSLCRIELMLLSGLNNPSIIKATFKNQHGTRISRRPSRSKTPCPLIFTSSHKQNSPPFPAGCRSNFTADQLLDREAESAVPR